MSEVRRYKHQWIEHGVDHHGQPIEIDMEADVVDAVDHDRVVAELKAGVAYKQKQVNEYWAKLVGVRPIVDSDESGSGR